MNQITDNTSAAKAKYELEQTLLAARDWQLWEGEKWVTRLARDQFEFSVEWGKLIFAWWTDNSSQSWRLTAYEIADAELYCQATRGMGRETVIFTLRDPIQQEAMLADITNLFPSPEDMDIFYFLAVRKAFLFPEEDRVICQVEMEPDLDNDITLRVASAM